MSPPPLFGYVPSLSVKIYRFIARLIIKFFQLNNVSFPIAIELNQLLSPTFSASYNGKTICWYTPNGRVLWRAKTVLSEEPMLIQWMDELFNDSTIFLDIGANVGSYSIYATTKGVSSVYSCELDLLNCSILYQNIVSNNLTSTIQVLPFPASSTCRVVDIFFRDFSPGDALQSMDRNSPFPTVRSHRAHSLKMLAAPLDQVFATYSLDLPTHVKIDVDGNELEVINGMKNILANAKSVYFETSVDVQNDCDECLSVMYNLGYMVAKESVIFSKNMPDIKSGVNLLLVRL